MTTTVRTLLLCATAALVLPTTSEAQIKGLIKKKITGAASGESKASNDGKAYSAIGMGAGQHEQLTEDAIEDFIAGVKEEIRLRKEFKQQLLAYKSPSQLKACHQQFATSPEYQKIVMSLIIPENATAAQMLQAQEKMMKDVVAAQTRKCGADVNQEWPVQKRQERLAEIRTAGEAAFRAARTARTAKQSSGPSADELIFSATEEFDDFYNWMWDVVRAFCKSLDDGLIVKDKNGRFEFGFSHAKPFSYFMSQREAELEYAGCIYVKTHDELLDLLELQR